MVKAVDFDSTILGSIPSAPAKYNAQQFNWLKQTTHNR